jgi:hypothetical protein
MREAEASLPAGHSDANKGGLGVQGLHELLPFCTEKQAAAVLALIEHEGNATHAAASLGISRSTVRDAVRQARKKADAGTLRPLPPMHPEDHELKGVSVKRDGDGNITSQWDKSGKAPDVPAAFEPVPPGHHVSKVSTFVVNGKPVAQWIQAPQDKIEQEAALMAALESHVTSYVRPVEPLAPPTITDGRLQVHYMLGDPHVGMLAWGPEVNGADFDLKIAEADLHAAMDRLVAGAAPSTTCRICNLGDFFHAQDDKQATPKSGNKLSCDSRAFKVLDVGIGIKCRLIDRALEKHEIVYVDIVPGNHDPMAAIWLQFVIRQTYKNEPRVIVTPNADPYLFSEFGANMFLICHGDGAPAKDLPGLMAARQPELWGRTRYRFAKQGHLHHSARKEYPGCLWECFQTLATKDDWHHKEGYDSIQSACAITYHETFGEFDRKIVGLELARAWAALQHGAHGHGSAA